MKRLSVLLIAMMFIVFNYGNADASELWVAPGQPMELKRCGEGVLLQYETQYGALMVAHVKGTHFEMGRQYGCLLGDKIVQTMMVYTDSKSPEEMENTLVFRMVSKVWEHLEPYVPEKYKQEIAGIEQGAREAGVDVPGRIIEAGIGLSNFSDMNDKSVLMSKVFRDKNELRAATGLLEKLFRTTCSAYAIWGSRTLDGKLYASRDLDWDARTGINKFSLVTVYQPVTEDGEVLNKYATVGYAGIIGAVAGMNENGITLGEIGSENLVEDQDGTPWTIMFREVLEQADDLEEAIDIIGNTNGTVGYNFVISDGDPENFGTDSFNPGGVAIEKNAEYTVVFRDNDPMEAAAVWIDTEGEPVLQDGEEVGYGLVMHEAVYRADGALAAEIRRTQIADNGPAKENGDGDPRSAGSYKKRYAPHYYFFKALENGTEYVHEDRVAVPSGEKARLVDIDQAIKMVDVVSMKKSNILAVIYNPTDLDMWVSYESDNDEEWKPASANQYVKFNLMDLLSSGE